MEHTARTIGKLEQKDLADTIKKFVEYATLQGSRSANRYYTHFAKLSNTMVGIKTGEREMTTVKVITTQTFIMELIKRTIEEEMAKGTFYKAIYEACKENAAGLMQYISPKRITA